MTEQSTTTTSAKTQPHSREAEQSVLGGLLLDTRAWDKIADRLVAEDFYFPAHQTLFQTMTRLVNRQQPLDVLTVVEALKSESNLDAIGGENVVFELANRATGATNIEAHSDIVREHAVLRHLIDAGQSISEMGFKPEGRDYHELVNDAESKIFSIAEHGAETEGPEAIARVLNKTTEMIDEMSKSDGKITGISTGFHDLDKMTGGLQRGDLVVVAGRPSMGKTVLGINIAEHVAISNQLPVVVFSLEMPSHSIVMRMLSSLGRINQQRLRTGQLKDEEWPRVSSAVGMVSKAKMFIDDTPALSPTEMRARVRRIARQEGQIGLVVVDYLQLMRVPGYKENRTNEISEISRTLKALAKECNAPVVALSQLNRSLEQRHDRRPVMSDLRESGAIEQDADIIAFIYRDEVYNENSPDKGIAEIIISKHRNGPIGKVRFSFMGEFTKFENYATEEVF